MSDEGVWRTVFWIDKDGVRREMEWRPLTREEIDARQRLFSDGLEALADVPFDLGPREAKK